MACFPRAVSKTLRWVQELREVTRTLRVRYAARQYQQDKVSLQSTFMCLNNHRLSESPATISAILFFDRSINSKKSLEFQPSFPAEKSVYEESSAYTLRF